MGRRNDEIDSATIKRQCPFHLIDPRLGELGIVNRMPSLYRAPDAVKAVLNVLADLFNVYGVDD